MPEAQALTMSLIYAMEQPPSSSHQRVPLAVGAGARIGRAAGLIETCGRIIKTCADAVAEGRARRDAYIGCDGWVISDVKSPHDSLRPFLAQHGN